MTNAGGSGGDRRQAWRGGRPARAAAPRAPDRGERWQRSRRPEQTGYERRRFELLLQRLGMSAAAIGLVALLLYLFIDTKPSVPLVMAVVSDHPAPLGPLSLADEDRGILESLGSGRASLGRGTARPVDVLRGLEAVDKQQLRDAIRRAVAETRGGGPGRNTAIVYVTTVGGVDRDGRACLVPPRLALSDPADADRSWLRVTDLLDDLVALEKKPGHVIVVLDACRRGFGEALGIIDGGFAAAVAADVLAANRPGVSVIVSAGPGETACAAAPDAASVFAATFVDGIEGCSDADKNGRVSLRELAAYLADEVGRRALLRHGRRQTPFLVPPLAERDRDPGVSWAVRREPQTWTARDTSGDPPEGLGWIDTQWNDAERLRARGLHERPEAWALLERLLVRAERLAAAGGSAQGPQQRTAREDVEELVKQLREPLFPAEALPSLRLAQLAGAASGDADAGWKTALESWQRAAAPATDAGPPPPRDVAEWRTRTREAWQAAVRRIAAGAVIDRESWKAWETLVGPRPDRDRGGSPWPFEVQTARLLVRWGQRDAWRREPGTFGRVIALADDARQAALPDDVRAEQLLLETAPRRDADRARREAFDLAAIGDEPSLARAANLAVQAAKGYAGVAEKAAELSAAWRLLDEIRAELPWLAAWHRRLAVVADERPQTGGGEVADWQVMVDAAERLERALAQPAAGRAAETLAAIRDAAGAAERPFRAIRAAYDDACGRLADPSADNAATLAEVRNVLSVPLVVGRQRERLRRRERELVAAVGVEQERGGRGQQAATPSRPATAAGLAAAGWVRWKGGLLDPVVAAVVPGATAVREPQSVTEVAAAHAAWGQKLRESLAAPQRAESVAADADAAASRRLAILRAGLPDGDVGVVVQKGAATEQLRRRWQTRLVAEAAGAMDEFLAGSERDEAEWFVEAARGCLTAAAGLAAAGPTDPLAEKSLARLEVLASARDRWAVLENDPDRIGGGDGSGSAPVTSTLRIAGGVGELVPAGDAALWLSPGSPDEALWLGRVADDAAGSAPARRVPLPVAKPDAGGLPRAARWRVGADSAGMLRPEERGSLDLTAWFRGHRIPASLRLVADGGGVPVVWKRPDERLPRISVAGREKKHGYVSLVYDCSGSMTTARMEKGRRALSAVLESLAQTGSWDASVWLYGHRAGWTQKPPYEVEYSDLGKKQKLAVLPKPEEDVEQIQRMAFVTPTQVQQLRPVFDSLRGWGETPLYLAMRSALVTDTPVVPAGDLWRIIVLTDGVNRVARGDAPTTARDVMEELKTVNRTRGIPVTIDVVALDLQPQDTQERTAYEELRGLVKDTRGQWRDAADLDQLKQAFRDFLGLVRWETVDAAGTPRQAEIGHALEVAPGRYAVRLEGQPATESRVVLDGGEILELFAVGADRPLEHRRYDGGTEQGIRSSQPGLEDPVGKGDGGAFPQRWFVAAHLPRREGASRVRFPVSLQNDDPAGFSPRPVELWAEVRPRGVAGARPFVFSDPDLEPSRPVPVVDLPVDAWPQDAEEAEILVWFSPRPLDPAAVIRIDDLVFDEKRPFRFAEKISGATFETLLKKIDDTRARLTVVERHAEARDLPRLRLRIEPTCERVEHVVDEAAASVRHVFDLSLDKGRVPADTRLEIVGRDELKEHCVKPAAAGGRTEPLRVRLPPRE